MGSQEVKMRDVAVSLMVWEIKREAAKDRKERGGSTAGGILR